VASVLVDGGSDLVGATVLACAVGVIAYAALFVLLGLLVRNAIVWGLAYVLIWEGIVAGYGNIPARLSVRGYTRSIITSRTGVDLDLGDLSLTPSVVVPIVAAVAALAFAARRLKRMDVA
jgi:ABC-2 type transport system permease protein